VKFHNGFYFTLTAPSTNQQHQQGPPSRAPSIICRHDCVSVAFSYLGKDFWSALIAKNDVDVYNVLYKYVGALLLGAPVVTLDRFQKERLAIYWREWMTDRTLQLHQDNRVYYALERGREVDNPDQRISENVKSFTSFSLTLFLTVVASIIDLVSFSFILYSIYYPQLFIIHLWYRHDSLAR
jgi:putative ATP-binding cassette transporter